MCGIVTVFKNINLSAANDRVVSSVMEQLTYVGALRGWDSTGMVTKVPGQPVSMYKRNLQPSDFLQLKETTKLLQSSNRSRFLVVHSRAATKGSVTTDNAHPFQHGSLTGVHNGTLRTWANLTTESFSTDSEHIYHALSKNTFEDVLQKLNGAFTLIWYDDSTNHMHVIRNNERPFTFIKVKEMDALFGASEVDMLKWILKRNDLTIEKTWSPAPMQYYVFDMDNPTVPLSSKKIKEYEPPKSNWVNTNEWNNDYTYYDKRSGARSRTKMNNEVKVTFKKTKFSPYHTNSATGRTEGRSVTGLDITINNTRANDLEMDVNYEGIGISRPNGVVDVQYNTVKKLRDAVLRLPSPQKKKEVVDDTGLCIEGYDSCEICDETILDAGWAIIDDCPVCQSCFSTLNRTNCGEVTYSYDEI